MREPADLVREPSANAVREAPATGVFWRAWARNVAIAGAAGVFLALVGAAGTADTSLTARLFFWTPLMMLGVLIGGGVAALATRLLPARTNIWLLGFVVTLGVALLGGGFVLLYSRLYWGAQFYSADWPRFVSILLAISAAMTAIMIAVNRPGAATYAATAGAPARQTRFLERLPAKLKGAALYAVEAEDHYLRLHTSKGSDLILMRLADAIAELDGVEGAQTHRSWWVARAAVESVRRDGEKLTLVLKGGAVAPVSRPNVRALREAAWF